MEVEQIQTQGSKFPRLAEEEDGHQRGSIGITNNNNGVLSRFCGWPASRIVRVSRASGGKDRHSKVWTSKGLRDRRVRLSVHTAIQFYDLQDRLGYDQPSKAVDWLLKAAAGSIDELPAINTSFPNTPKDESAGFPDPDPLDSAQPSSNSENSRGSGGQLSLSRSENRVKARERAKERRAGREKERESNHNHNHNDNTLSTSSFTELLTTGEAGGSLFDKHRQWGSNSAMDYFSIPQYQIQNQNQNQNQNQSSQELHQFSLLPDHMMPAADLSFTMSSSSSRGTLQSNSPQQHQMLLPHHHHHYGSGVPFFVGTAAAPLENHHHQFPAGLHLCYGDGHLDHKGKGKN